MLRTKSIIQNISEVPREWVFEFYLCLKGKLDGSNVKVKSPFSIDNNPSLYIFYSDLYNHYMFKDFSTSKSGDGATLVQMLFKYGTRDEAVHRITTDYMTYIQTNNYTKATHVTRTPYKVTDYVVRKWTDRDAKYWLQFHIGSDILQFYNVLPLEQFTITREEDGYIRSYDIKDYNIYGYFRADGTLYKIYQPLNKEHKFFKVNDYIQGSDQLTMKVPYLVMCSSLKDIMAFKRLGYTNAETVAPDSENTLLPGNIIVSYNLKYKGMCTLLDNDTAGINAMKDYRKTYNIPGAVLVMSKDLSDSLRDYGVARVRQRLTPLLRNTLNIK